MKNTPKVTLPLLSNQAWIFLIFALILNSLWEGDNLFVQYLLEQIGMIGIGFAFFAFVFSATLEGLLFETSLHGFIMPLSKLTRGFFEFFMASILHIYVLMVWLTFSQGSMIKGLALNLWFAAFFPITFAFIYVATWHIFSRPIRLRFRSISRAARIRDVSITRRNILVHCLMNIAFLVFIFIEMMSIFASQ
ncbi:MAG: hypothetical protein AAFX40_06195 [Cyanobacteria bacterium J06639_1]